ncbi:MAG: sensor histidine kinase [Acidimicrobiia bacterium]|nr:sensor histidine kinase [Acidimicrobiia bacterium]
MLESLFHPWTTNRTWRSLTHVLLDSPISALGGTTVLVLLVAAAALVVTFPLALPFAWLMFVAARGMGRLERSRFAALLDVELAEPYLPLPPGSWWAHLKARTASKARWREVAYCLLHLPVSVLTAAVALVLWCGSVAFAFLPLYIGALPRDRADLGLFEVGFGPGAYALAVAGLAGLVLVAPWATLALAALDTALGRALLGPARQDQLEAEVERLEASRSAAVGSADSERRRIERDLHDGAQQRLVALAMDLGMAKQHFDDDPDKARSLVGEAHDEAKAALTELRDLVRGFQPSILEARGLDAALSPVIARSPVPVRLHVDVAERPPPAVEHAAYFIVAEALANVAKHARATKATVAIARRGARLAIDITDDGIGGAVPALGSGLAGLEERVRGLGGWATVLSPAGGPTTVMAELPCGS